MDTTERGIGIAIFGLGRAGSIHTKNCAKNKRIDLRYLVDLDVDNAKKFIADYKLKDAKPLAPKEINVVLDDPLVDGVVIASYTEAHEEQVLQCIKAKKAVFCEKPLAETYKEIERCYIEAESNKVPLLCAFNRRFDPSHSAVRDGVLQGKVGQLQLMKSCSRDSPLPPLSFLKVSHGMFQDCAIHDIDLIMWTVGEKPVLVTAQGHAFRKEIANIDDVDTVAITLKFPSGVLAVIDLSRFAAYGYDQRLEAFGDAGMLQSKNQTPTSVCLSDGRGVCDDVIMYSFPQRYATAYENELNHFLDVIEGSDCIITKQDVLAASRVAQACQQSHEIGQSIKLSWQ
eukprot:gene15319-16896_t